MIVRDEVEKFKKEEISVRGDIVSLDDIARKRGVILESVRTALEGFKASGYARVGDLFLSNNKLEEIDEKLRGVQMPTGALQVLEGCGVKDEGQKVLDALGYTSIWEGMGWIKSGYRSRLQHPGAPASRISQPRGTPHLFSALTNGVRDLHGRHTSLRRKVCRDDSN